MLLFVGLLLSLTFLAYTSNTKDSYSPPKYPSPRTSSEGNWAEAYAKAASFVEQLTLLEKVNLTTGIGYGGGRCLGETGSIPRLNFFGLCVQLLPINVSFAEYTSAFPAGINIGATWNREYAYLRGDALGAELRAKGTDIVLTPQVSPMGRFPGSGRNWEAFSPDPYLTGEMVAPTVKGIQRNRVVSTIRHFIANEQEHFRFLLESEQNGFNITESISANLDDRTMHEIYLWPFANAVKAGAGAIMCSYNQINNSYGCANSYTLNYLLKNELGFQGFVMSDFNAQHSGVSSAVAGLDMSMPGDVTPFTGASYWGTNLTLAVANGTLPQWRLDDMCMRIMAAYYQVGGDIGQVSVNFDSFTTQEYGSVSLLSNAEPSLVNEDVPVRGNYKSIVREIGAASTVLLKNNGILPLTGQERHIALIGKDAGSNPNGANGCPNQGCNEGTLAQGWGSSTVLYPYLVTPEQAISNHIFTHTNGTVSTITNNTAHLPIAELASQASVAIVFVNANSGEGFLTVDGNYGDRNNLSLWEQGDDLIGKVAAQCQQTIVVMHTVGPVLVSEWYDHENVTAILWAGLPGQESGNSLVDILYGAYNPSGKLPFTIGPTANSYGSKLLFSPNNGNDAPQQDLSGLDLDYRHFGMKNITPVYEFGFGLSYTSFSYSDLQISLIDQETTAFITPFGGELPKNNSVQYSRHWADFQFPWDIPQYEGFIYPYLNNSDPRKASEDADYGQGSDQYLPLGFNDTEPPAMSPSGGGPGGHPRLWEPIANVTAIITNTGAIPGHEVAQLHVGLGSDEPPVILRGFDRLYIQPGETETFCAQLLRRDVSTWNAIRQDWDAVEDFVVYVGPSSRNLPLSATVSL